MQIRDFKWKNSPRVLLCSSANKSPKWSWGNSTLFVNRSSMENRCTEGRTQVFFISSAFFPVYLLSLCFIYSLKFTHRQKFWGWGNSSLSFSFAPVLLKGFKGWFFFLFVCLKLVCLFWLVGFFGRGFTCLVWGFFWFCLAGFLYVFFWGGVL